MHWKGYPLVTGVAIQGGTIDDFLKELQTADRKCDLTLHWTLNGQYKKRSKGPKVLQDLYAEFFINLRRMTDVIKDFNQSIVICGEAAACWELDPRFDAGANKVRKAMRGYGILTFDGILFFMAMRPYLDPTDGWHYRASTPALDVWKQRYELEVQTMHLARKPRTWVGGAAYPKAIVRRDWTHPLVQAVVVPLAPRPKHHGKGRERRKDSPHEQG